MKEIIKTGKRICREIVTKEEFYVTKWAEDEKGNMLYAIEKVPFK